MRHIKCGTNLLAKAKVTSIFFNTFLVINDKKLTLNPTQIVGDHLEFVFEDDLYCPSCRKDVSINSDEILLGYCPACREPVSPVDSEIVTYEESTIVCHKKCHDNVINDHLTKFGIKDFNIKDIKLVIEEI